MASSIINSDDGVVSGTSGIKTTGGDDGVLVFQSKGTETARINTDKQIVAAAGTASLPALTTTGDVNTGIFFPAADTIAFGEGGAEAMRINSSGNVGIGTTSPTEKCHIYASSGNSFYRFQNAATGSGASDGGFVGIGSGGDVFLYNYEASNTIFATNNAERARIDSSGSLLVGTTSNNFASSNHKMVIASDSSVANPFGINNLQSGTGSSNCVFFGRNGTFTGGITNTGTTTAFNTSSDYRLKESVVPLTDALQLVSQLNPVSWVWKADGSAGQGFIAHELQEIVPDCVTGEKDAVDDDGNPKYQGVDTSFLVATLTAAIQELSAKNDALEARIAALEQA
jgi:hypothetical protein